MAGVGASARQKIKIYVPESAPEAKIVQSLMYGAEVIRVHGSYDEAFETAMKEFYVRSPYEVVCRNTAFNPLTIEGKKTVVFEIVSQLLRVPDVIFIPSGDGVILSGVYKGLEDLLNMSLITHIPTLYAVQAEGSSSLQKGFENGSFPVLYQAKTYADSISVNVPRCGFYALSKLKKHNGKVISVTDDEIMQAQRKLAASEGLFVEPAAASAFAGFIKIADQLQENSTNVILLTGHGLKDIVGATNSLKKTSS